jgi:hypothetical protein
MENATGTIGEPAWRSLSRWAGISGLLFGAAYVVILGLYATVGAPPATPEAWLAYAAGKAGPWWAILGLSVLTDMLLVPFTLALYVALRGMDRSLMLLGAAFVALFVVLDLAVTWPNYAVRIALADDYASATSEAARAADLGAVTYASAVLGSTLWAMYSIVTLSVGILVISLVMRQTTLGRAVSYVGIAIGVLGVVAVAGPLVSSAFAPTIILASLLTTIWVPLTGYRLLRLA